MSAPVEAKGCSEYDVSSGLMIIALELYASVMLSGLVYKGMKRDRVRVMSVYMEQGKTT